MSMTMGIYINIYICKIIFLSPWCVLIYIYIYMYIFVRNPLTVCVYLHTPIYIYSFKSKSP